MPGISVIRNVLCLLVVALLLCCATPVLSQDFQQTARRVSPKIVKIVGSGGFQGLEPYQSGLVVSSEGHILTVWSYVLDSDVVTVTLDDGQKFEAELVGYDPRIEIAILKIEARGVSGFNLDEAIPSDLGARILAFSNLYGVATGNESVSVQHGIVAAKTTLSARRGAFAANYNGKVYVLDAITNNPGAAGGVITDRKGRLIGLIGKELRNEQTGSWLNFAIPIEEISPSVNEILAGKMVVQLDESQRKPSEPMTTDLIGLVLVPNVVSRTPPFVDRVIPNSAADIAGLRPDDLIIEVNGRMTPSRSDVLDQFSYVDRDAALNITIQRGNEFHSIEVRLTR